MPTEAIHPMSALFDPAYAKTAKGRGEVERRSLGLNARQRSVLIMVDGRKPRSALAAMLPAGTVDAVLDALLALDLIEPAHTHTHVPVAAPAPVVATEAAARLARVKAQMVDTAQTYLGLMAAEVVRRIDRAGDAEALLGVIGHWHMALQASKHGRDMALAHVERVKAELREQVAA